MNYYDEASFDFAMNEFKNGKCTIQTKIKYMIGKLCFLNRKYSNIENSKSSFSIKQEKLNKIKQEIKVLENEIYQDLDKLQ